MANRHDEDRAAERLREGYEQFQDKADHAAEDFGAWVRRNPGLAVLGAMAAGLVAGFVARERRP